MASIPLANELLDVETPQPDPEAEAELERLAAQDRAEWALVRALAEEGARQLRRDQAARRWSNRRRDRKPPAKALPKFFEGTVGEDGDWLWMRRVVASGSRSRGRARVRR